MHSVPKKQSYSSLYSHILHICLCHSMSTSIGRDGLTWNEGLAERQLNGLVTDGIAGLNDGVMGNPLIRGI